MRKETTEREREAIAGKISGDESIERMATLFLCFDILPGAAELYCCFWELN